MRKTKVSAQSDSKRMFESDFFEFFSRIPPWQPPVIFIPLISLAFWQGLVVGVGIGPSLALFLAGLVLWSLTEYWAHRVIFHFEAKSKLGKRIFWILHGVHHDWPNDKYRLVFPPGMSLPLAGLFFGLFTLTTGELLRFPLMSGFMAGYLAYDMIHYWTHHFSPRSRLGKFLRRYHLEHHFKDPDAGYGVSTPVWDYVFGTAPARAPKTEAAGPAA
jgi:dihydroceramide fatty acyl 2-hydroxylase